MGSSAALTGRLVEHDGARGGDVQRADAAGHGNAQQVVAGAADQVMKTGSFAAENEDAIASEIEAVVVGLAALVEADNPEIAAFEIFEGANEVDDAGDAKMLGCAGAGLDRDGAEGSGTALGKDDAIDTGAVGHAQQCAQVLRVFYTVESEEQAGLAGGAGRGWERFVEIFDGKKFLGTDQGNYALVGRSCGELSQLLTGFGTNADTGLAASLDEMGKAVVVALAGHDHVVKTAATGLEGFLDRMKAVENFHEG